MNNDLLRYVLVALVLAFGIIGLALCGDGLCPEGPHVCCGATDRSNPLVRIVRHLRDILMSAVSLALLGFGLAFRRQRWALARLEPTLVLLKVSTLRI